MPARGLILFKKANDSVAKAAQTVAEGTIFNLYADVPDTVIEASGPAFARHSEAGGDWKGWAEYARAEYNFFIVFADDCEVAFDPSIDEGAVTLGKGTYGVLDLVTDMEDILVYYKGALYDGLELRETDSRNWKAYGVLDFGIADDSEE